MTYTVFKLLPFVLILRGIAFLPAFAGYTGEQNSNAPLMVMSILANPDLGNLLATGEDHARLLRRPLANMISGNGTLENSWEVLQSQPRARISISISTLHLQAEADFQA